MRKKRITSILCFLLITLPILSACTKPNNKDNLVSVSVSSLLKTPHNKHDWFINSFIVKEFSDVSEITFKGQPLITATTPDGWANLQILGSEENIQSVRVLGYLPVDATKDLANQYLENWQLLLTCVFLSTGKDLNDLEDWLDVAIKTASKRNDNALRKGVKVSKIQTLDEGTLTTTLYVRMIEDDQSFIMGLIVGDWLEDIGYDPVLNSWLP